MAFVPTIIISKLLSLVIALLYAGWLMPRQVAGEALLTCTGLLVPLDLIWFPEELGRMTRFFWNGRLVTDESPPILLIIIGWLFGMPVLLFLLS